MPSSDAAESIVNIAASGFAYYSIYLAAQPKDENHPYGHGKVEFFSVFVEGALIFIAGSVILIKALQYLLSSTRSECRRGYHPDIHHFPDQLWGRFLFNEAG